MKEQLYKLLDATAPEELLTCIQLLALSIVQHREQAGFVSLETSLEKIRDTPKSGNTFKKGGAVLEEALELVRALAAESASETASEAAPVEQQSEGRGQLRIHVMAPVQIMWPGDSSPVDAKLENISWGGAAIQVDQLHTHDSETLTIVLPDTQGGSLTVEATILRTWDLADGTGYGLATRFSGLSTHDEDELENLLELLAKSADKGGQRNSARLTQRIDIQFDGVEELKATLDDISAGGLGITVPDPLRIGQSLQAVISTMDETCSLKLRARVIRQDPIKLGKIEVYHAGLKFEHPPEELKASIDELLSTMATAKNATFG